MRKKIVTILSVALVGTFITGCHIEIGSSRRSTKNSISIAGDVNETISIDGVSNLNLDIGVSDIDIYVVDGNEVKIERVCRGKVYGELNIDKDGDTINIIEEGVKTKLNNISHKNSLKIGVPKEFKGNLELDYGVGDCNIEALTFNDAEISSGVGTLEINNLICNDFSLEQGVGDSDITLEKSGEIQIEGGVGKTELYIKEVGGNLTYEGGVGDADIYIPKNSPVRFETESGLGKCKVKAETSGENTYVYDLSVGMGNINVDNR